MARRAGRFRRLPLGFALQLFVQLPLGTLCAALRVPLSAAACALAVCLIPARDDAWATVGKMAGEIGLTTALPWALAALPAAGSANAKAHALCSNHFAAVAQRVLGGGGRRRGGESGGAAAATAAAAAAAAAAAPLPPSGGERAGVRLCDCLFVWKGGVLPIDRLALALVRWELRRGTADVGAADGRGGRTALHWTAFVGLPRTARALLEAGADPNLQDQGGQTALHVAVHWFGRCEASYWGFVAWRRRAIVVWCLLVVAGALLWAVVRWPPAPLVLAFGILQFPLSLFVLKPSALARLRRTAEVLYAAQGADLGTTDNSGQTAMMQGGRVGAALLAPQPAWADVERALAGANPGAANPGATAPPNALLHPVLALLPQPVHDVLRLRLFDMLHAGEVAGSTEAEQLRRQRLVFDGLVAPLVRAAVRRPLPSAEKQLLVSACEATARGRAQHRAAYDTLVGDAMSTFERELSAAYAALSGSTAGRTLLALPPTELLGDTGKAGLSQCAELAMGRAVWLEGPPSLAGAYAALVGAGALRGIDDMCALLQSGRHRWFASAHREHFGAQTAKLTKWAETWTFWLHICALHSVARNEQRNAEFQARVRGIASAFGGAVSYKEAPLKKYERIVVKAQQYHAAGKLPKTAAGAAEAVGRVIDIQRCSLEVADAATAMAVVQKLKSATLAEHGMRPLRCKNGFNAAAESTGGYRDVKLNMIFQAKDVPGAAGRAVVEIQVILKQYLAVKKRMHAVYRLDRGDFDTCKKVSSR